MTERAHAMDGSAPVEWRTSETHPYAVDWVDLRGVPGLAGAAAPRTGRPTGIRQR